MEELSRMGKDALERTQHVVENALNRSTAALQRLVEQALAHVDALRVLLEVVWALILQYLLTLCLEAIAEQLADGLARALSGLVLWLLVGLVVCGYIFAILVVLLVLAVGFVAAYCARPHHGRR
jgi:hypothetical protein